MLPACRLSRAAIFVNCSFQIICDLGDVRRRQCRDKLSLDLFWIKDKSLTDTDGASSAARAFARLANRAIHAAADGRRCGAGGRPDFKPNESSPCRRQGPWEKAGRQSGCQTLA
jgi:hypothetical protein